MHNVQSRKTGGDSPDNLITLAKLSFKFTMADRIKY